MPTLEEIQKQIPAKRYNELLDLVELRDLYLNGLKTSLRNRKIHQNTRFQYRETSDVVEFSETAVRIEARYELAAVSGRSRVFDIKASYVAEFSLREPIPKEFFELYKVYNLPLQTFPFLRELVNNLITRMGLPPLILPLRKHLIGADH